MNLTFAYTRLLVNDFAACFRFYSEVMGLDVVMRTTDDVYAEFKTGDVTLALFRRDFMAHVVGAANKPADANVQDRVALGFEVNDVDAACAELQQRGADIVVPAQDRPDWVLRTAHLRDPDGNLIEIYHNLPS